MFIQIFKGALYILIVNRNIAIWIILNEFNNKLRSYNKSEKNKSIE